MIPLRFFWLLDAVALWLAFLGAYSLVPILRMWMEPGNFLYLPGLFALLSYVAWAEPMPSLHDLLWIYLIMLAAASLVLRAFRDYGRLLYQSRMRIIVTSVLAALSGISLVTLVTFALKGTEWSRLFVVSFMVLSALILSGYRLLLRRYFLLRQSSGVYAKNVLLLGQHSALEWMIRYFEATISPTEYRLLGQLCVNGNDAAADVPCLGDVADLGDLLIHYPIHEVIAIQPATEGSWLKKVIEDCDYFRVALRIVPEVLLFNTVHDLKILYRNELLRLPAVVLAPPHLDSDTLFVKRLLDIAVSAALLVLLSPLFLLTALAIKLTSPHLPVIYTYRAVGYKGKLFAGYKFTSMVADADEQKAELANRNEMSGPVFKIKDDPRITPLGRFLRKYSIDELPQMWCVLKGDMSLVGPRPALIHELEHYEFWHKRKLSIRPGITCLWQIRGRNKISHFDDWVRMDLEYIDHWSLWLDFRILVRTAWVVIAGTGS